MRLDLFLIAGVTFAVACSQIAGFEEFSGGEGSAGSAAEPAGGQGGASAGAAANGGSAQTEGGAGGELAVVPSAGTGGVEEAAAGAAGMNGTGARRGCDEQLLINADFDQGPVHWQEDSSWTGIETISDIIIERNSTNLLEYQVEPDTGDYLAWFGGVPDTDQKWRINLLQSVTIPIEVTRLVLTGRIRIATEETEALVRNDQLDLGLAQGEEQWWSLHVWDNRDSNEAWDSFEIINTDFVDVFRGKELTFIAESMTDNEGETHFWLDSLKLEAECRR